MKWSFLTSFAAIIFALNVPASEPCADVTIPPDRKINYTLHRPFINNIQEWAILGAFTVNKSPHFTFVGAKKFESLEAIIPFINIFNLSEDHKTLKAGIKLFPGVSFQQVFQIAVVEEHKQIKLQFTEGSFAGLSAQLCFIPFGDNQTAVLFLNTGNLSEDPLPFFVTDSMLESLSKSMIRRWRKGIEAQE